TLIAAVMSPPLAPFASASLGSRALREARRRPGLLPPKAAGVGAAPAAIHRRWYGRAAGIPPGGALRAEPHRGRDVTAARSFRLRFAWLKSPPGGMPAARPLKPGDR